MQQVNLYQPILRKQEKVFSLKTLLQGNLLIIAALGLIYFFSLYQSHSLRSRHQALQQDLVQRSEDLVELQQQFPARTKDPAVAMSVEQKQSLLNYRKHLLRELQHQNTGADGNPGFSEQLSGLARQDTDSLWLDEISVRDGKQLTLRGWAKAPEEIPRHIQRLNAEPSFSGTAFSKVQISRDEDDNSVVGFRLQTEQSEEDAAP